MSYTRPVFHRSESGPLPKRGDNFQLSIISIFRLTTPFGSGPNSDLWKTGRVAPQLHKN